jgi:hypothetical protein
MKKLILSLVAAMVCATASYAQTSVATLNHENSITVFNGPTAFAEAMNAAVDGDMITLSSGTFAATDITKAVTLRGAGIREDAITGQYITQISNNFALNVSTVEQKLSVEGIIFTGTITKKSPSIPNATFNKCQFSKITCSGYTTHKAENWTFTNCNITGSIWMPQGSTASFVNCRVFNPETSQADSNPATLDFVNCIVVDNSVSGFQGSPALERSKFSNCFIFKTSTNTSSKALPASNEAHNCVGYDALGTAPIFGNINKATNTELTTDEYNALFKEGTFYELTDEAKAKYIGNDGTEVGLYGGVLPYTTRIMNPQITKCNVAKKTTTDGKLSVDLEVKAAE